MSTGTRLPKLGAYCDASSTEMRQHTPVRLSPSLASCPAGEGGFADSGAGRHRCRHASFPLHEEEEEEEEEEKDEAASLIPLVVFLRPLVTCSIWFLPEEYNSALLGSTVDTCS